MQIATAGTHGGFMTPIPPQLATGDPVRASVGHLLTRAYSLPCSTAAQAFNQLVQPTARFQLALDALFPLLDPNTQSPAELTQRILVSFILYSLYAPHPIAINPFKSVLFVTFVKEREQAVRVANSGGISANEQLVWVLWKILKGDGNDIGPYSPNTLARSPLPPKLRATNLILDDDIGTHDFDDNGNNIVDERTNNGSGDSDSRVTAEEDAHNENVAQAMNLLLAARERVLTLSEQRLLGPLIPELTASRMITSLDLSPLIAHNPTVAYPLFVSLLTTNLATEEAITNISNYLDVLPFLPPTLATFDLIGRLLRDATPTGRTTIADLVRMEVLGRFTHESINWLERAEQEEKEGIISDDRFAKGVQNLCRFYNSLIKLGVVDATSDIESAEMAQFSLRNARFEEANALYRVFALVNA